MSEAILRVAGVSKRFSLGLRQAMAYGLRDVAREFLPSGAGAGTLRPGEFWALQDVSFELRRGEALAVVGHNGAGKSTLLKILYGLIKPDRGEVRIRGRTEAIIELGTGFNGVLSGRENVEVGAALHGLDAPETRRLLDEVIDFAEIEPFIDAPVQSYSSGMRARLAFALSALMHPDLLLIDEVLAVGDLAFQRKCIAQMRSYLNGGGSLLLVSHSVHQVQAICRQAIRLERGRLAGSGTAANMINEMFEAQLENVSSVAPSRSRQESLNINKLCVEPIHGTIKTGEPLRLRIEYSCQTRVDVIWGFEIWTSDKWVCVTGAVDERTRVLHPGTGSLSCLLPRFALLPGRYLVRAHILDPSTSFPIATFGHDDAGVVINVRSVANIRTNGQVQVNQLVIADVDWGECKPQEAN